MLSSSWTFLHAGSVGRLEWTCLDLPAHGFSSIFGDEHFDRIAWQLRSLERAALEPCASVITSSLKQSDKPTLGTMRVEMIMD